MKIELTQTELKLLLEGLTVFLDEYTGAMPVETNHKIEALQTKLATYLEA